MVLGSSPVAVTILNYCCYYFDGPWKVKALYVIIMSRKHLRSEYTLCSLTLSRRRLLSYRNQSIDLRSKSMDWFLYDSGLRLERVNECQGTPFSKQVRYLKFKWIPYRQVLATQVNHFTSLVKWLSVRLRTKWLHVWIPLLSHIVLCSNAFFKLQNTRGASGQPVLMGISILVYMCRPYQSVHCRWCAGYEILWPRERCLLRRKLAWQICK